ncbi:RNA polymerase sigma factor [Kineococcus rubinsiae]|uniref:RNA polymerase sigma factor n=1 Tax=Kineococcus rubinsiae TaxID=2609562 RepID=UPI0014304D70|nr:sigma-70 family RNA polymerase sigma factor [Kineococcus rubinsiae]NIZ91555.1 sigma-70 family RNA polymerase sigma factor [Kineococcus rubinsiae]
MQDEDFSALYAGTSGDVWRFARRRTASSAEADDVTAETYAVAWRRRADVPPEAPRLWLFGVARNVLANHRRELSRRRGLQVRVATLHPTPDVCDAPTGEPAGSAVWPALAALGAEDRDLLLMRAWDGLPVADIAVVLGVRAATVSSRLHRARGRLARELARRDPDAAGHVRDGHHDLRSSW